MSNENSVNDVPVVDSAVTENNGTPAQSESSGDSSELIASQQQELNDLRARNDGLSRKLGSIEAQIKKLVSSQEATVSEGKQRVVPEQSITAQDKEIETLRNELRREKVLSGIESALLKHGVTGNHQILAEYVERDIGVDNIKIENRNVLVNDGGVDVGLAEYMPAYLKTSRGDWMIPAKSANSLSMSGSTEAPTRRKVSLDDLNRMSPEELKNGSFDVVGV